VNKPKILILVSGGVADYLCIGDVGVQVVDEDNIGAGDPRREPDPGTSGPGLAFAIQ